MWFLAVTALLALRGPIVLAAPFVPARDAHAVAFSPDGKIIAVAISGQSNSEFPPRPHPSPRKCGVVQLFDITTKKRLRRIETFGDVTRVAFSPDGRFLAASRLFATDDGVELNEVRVWDVASGRTHVVFDRCHSFCFIPRSDEIVVSSRKRCVLYSLASLAKIRLFPDMANAICVVPVLEGQLLCGIVNAPAGYAIRTVAMANASVLAQSPILPEPFYQLATPADGSRIATGHDNGQILLWDAVSLRANGRITTGSPGRAFPFYASNGRLLGGADQSNGDVVIWSMPSGEEVARYTFRQGSIHTFGSRNAQRTLRPEEDPARFAFSPDGDAFLGGPYGGILRLVQDGRDIARFGD